MATLKGTGYGASARLEADYQDQEPLLGTQSSSTRPELEPFRDIEPEDSPPAYDEIENSAPTVIQHQENTETIRAETGSYRVPGGEVFTGGHGSYTITHERAYSADPDKLFCLIATQARLPPKVSVSVTGTHTVSTTRDGKTTEETVTDFNFRIDGNDTILPPLSRQELRGDYFDNYFRELSVIDDRDNIKAYRGGCIKERTTAQGRFPIVDFEQHPYSIENHQFPPRKYYEDLYMWCHRFCKDKAPLKSFTLDRKLLNWDFPLVEQEIISVIRTTNYRGNISVSPCTDHSSITIRSPCIINTLRANSFVWWACVILQLWIITWPIIFLAEKRYEVVRANYYVVRGDARSNPLSSETTWVQRFSPAICAAALRRWANGRVVTLSYADDLNDGRAAPLNVNAGSNTVADVVRGLSEVGIQWNLSLGWGGNE